MMIVFIIPLVIAAFLGYWIDGLVPPDSWWLLLTFPGATLAG
jgi:hypothetical protein